MSDKFESLFRSWFPEISEQKYCQLEAYAALVREWNERINLVSRKAIDTFEADQLAPCMAITTQLKLMSGARVLDVGTGGGLPGLPMAIAYPQAHFLLVDSVGKKIRAVEAMVKSLELKNVEVRHCRVESVRKKFDFIMGRAVTALPSFISWIKPWVQKGRKHSLENGLLYWKGGVLDAELRGLGIQPRHIWPLEVLLKGGTYPEKYILHFAAEDLARAKVPRKEH